MSMKFTFPELLRYYIQASGSTVYQLAKISGVNRTSVQKALKGERLPMRDAVEALASKMNLTAAEHSALMEAYEIEESGKNLYYQRKYVKHIVESMALYYEKIKSRRYIEQKTQVQFEKPTKKVFSGTLEIQAVLELLIKKAAYEDENKALFMLVSIKHDFYQNFMKVISQEEYKKLKIYQIVDFLKNPVESRNGNHNLEIFAGILPYILTKGENYVVYQRYIANQNETEENGFPFSDFILFQDSLLLLSSDFKTVWLEEDVMVIEYFKDWFMENARQSSILIDHCIDVFTMGQHFFNCGQGIEELVWIEFQPCFIPLCGDLIDRVANQEIPNRSELIQLAADREKQFKNVKNRIGIFTEKGLAEFVENGIIGDIPQKYVRPFTLEERCFLLEQLYHMRKEDLENVLILNENEFSISRHISISVHGRKELALQIFDHNVDVYHCISIQESTLVNSFADFIAYIIESKWVYTKVETLTIIEKYIQKLKDSA